MSVAILAAPSRLVAPPMAGPRQASGRILFIEDFRSPSIGFWNDGVGGASRDCAVTFAGMPSMRLDPQGESFSATDPGRTARTAGVVAKRRIHDGFTGTFGLELWFRMTSRNLTSSTYFSMSVYNRDGTNAHHGRFWLDPNGNNQPMIGKILDGAATQAASGTTATAAATYTPVVTSVLQNGAGSHTYAPEAGSLDKVGGWHYAKLVVDLKNKKYVSCTLDGQATVDLSSYTLDTTASTGFAGMHFSVELFASTTTRPRYVNVAQCIGTVE